MTGRSKRKGSRYEAEVVRDLNRLGIAAERVPLSGAVGGSFADDIITTIRGRPYRGECKIRANGFRELYRWVDPPNTDMLFVRADRQPTLAVLPLSLLAELIGGQNADSGD